MWTIGSPLVLHNVLLDVVDHAARILSLELNSSLGVDRTHERSLDEDVHFDEVAFQKLLNPFLLCNRQNVQV